MSNEETQNVQATSDQTTDAATTPSGNAQATIDTSTSQAEQPALSWFDKLPDDLKQEGSLSNFKDKDVTEVIKSYVNAQKAIGSMVRIPSQDAPQEVKEQFYQKLASIPDVVKLPSREDKAAFQALMNKLGRPEQADNYTVPETLSELPEELVPVTAIQEFKKLAHEVGLTNEQAAACLQFEIQRAQQEVAAITEKVETNKALLKQMWGADFDTRANAAKTMLNVFAQKYPDAVKEFNEGYNTNPIIYEALAELAQVYRERGHISGQVVDKFGLTPSEARAKIHEMRADIKGPLYDPSHRDHEAALEKLSDLYRLAGSGT